MQPCNLAFNGGKGIIDLPMFVGLGSIGGGIHVRAFVASVHSNGPGRPQPV